MNREYRTKGTKPLQTITIIDEEKHAPSLNEMLPYIVFKSIRSRKLLYQMLDGILTEPEEVRARYAV